MPAHTAPRTTRVLATTRLSDDPKGYRKEHATQRRAITGLVGREGWPPVAEEDWFTDTDRSASKEGVERPGWEALVETVKGIDPSTTEVIVVGYKQDRMLRQLGDLPVLANLLERKSGQLWTTKEGQLSVRKGGRVAFYVNGAVAANESEVISARTTDGIASAAIEGKPHGPAGYGWTRVVEGAGRDAVHKNVVNEAEKAVVRELAERVLAGESLRRIANDLNERGVPAPNAGAVLRRDPITREPIARAAGTWGPQKIRQVLLRKANIGVRVYTTASEDDAKPMEYRAKWEAILDEDVYAQVVAVLGAPERRVSRSNVARHLLSNIARCGVCDQPMTVQTVGQKGKKYAAYRCPVGHVAKAQAKTDAVVDKALLVILTGDTVRAALRRDDGGKAREAIEKVAALEAELRTLEEDRLNGGVTREQFLRMNRKWQADLAATKAVLKRRRDSVVYADLVEADDIRATWAAMPIDRRRAVVAALVNVVLHRNNRRGRSAFDPESITVSLRAVQDKSS